jgi:hypothetical protein
MVAATPSELPTSPALPLTHGAAAGAPQPGRRRRAVKFDAALDASVSDPATLKRNCAPATQVGLSTYECMDHQGRLFALQRIVSHSLLLKGINSQEIIYTQEE